ncbi:double-strand break repair protein AddB [Aureimonas sp. Leaf324]|uniref:double-strand break repair protein AddB n=1 Tax=Aureimonas sp. Leaf324 TaxID=1736336 RepID=UPI0006FEE393|nr:double-strand break repair protein AddB [Aureimonas sp. Leaf324]KQQ78923.1 double-strand break repair protein AddB [Aureimonas sp. Leaf324]
MPSHVFSIAPALPFLPTLARGVLDGRFLPGEDFSADPLALAGLTILVPTRRAARSLAGEFARAMGGASAILPSIRTLAEADEGAAFVDLGAAMAPAMDPLERHLLLARLVRFWKVGLNRQALRLLANEEIVLPASAADALYSAEDLCAFLDEAVTEEAGLHKLTGLAPDRLAEWWQLTLTFLSILSEQWPAILKERGVEDRASLRRRWFDAEAERLQASGSRGPILVAGSTATAPSTLRFLRAVAGLPNGAVILPGVDCHLDNASFDAIDRARSIAAPGHPQHALKRILQGLLVERDGIELLCPDRGHPLLAREKFLSDALRPAETTDAWSDADRRHGGDALDGLELIEAADEREEALAIAVAIRDALSDPSATVALTTPDRNLARRVSAELERFGVAANDSAGRPLHATPPGTFCLLALSVALEPGDPITLLSLLKHPLLRLGLGSARAREAARTIELIALRGGCGVADGGKLASLFAERRKAAEAEDGRAPRPVQLVPEEDRDAAQALAERLEAALQPLSGLRDGGEQELADYAVCLTRVLEALAAGEDGAPTALYAEEAGAALRDMLRSFVAAPETGFSFRAPELPDVALALMRSINVRPRGGLSQRVFIWGALEARLQNVDVMILGGLNEGTWPGTARSDAFLSRIMRSEIELDPPERRIGLAAHDIWMALGARRVVMARSHRAGGAPAIASRWLQRILTLAGPDGASALRARGETYLHHARRLDERPEELRAPRPEPKPPVDRRPIRHSFTEVETLVRDPYAVYARRVLRLDPLPEMIRAPGAPERGDLYHAILHRFVDDGIDPDAEDARDRLLAIAREAFDDAALPPEIEAVWWPRMETLATNMIAWERERAPMVAERLTEVKGAFDLPGIGVGFHGYADRIDRMRDGSVEIIDYKTGTTPSVKQARTLLSPQLPLEGAMARLGGFEKLGPVSSVRDLLYVRLRERDFYEERLAHNGGRTGEPQSGDDLSDAALGAFRGLAAAYRNPEKGYLSRARPFQAGDFSGPYDHLARAREWTAAGAGAADEDAVE